MNELPLTFLYGIGGIAITIILLKIFFTLWKCLEKKLHPEQFIKTKYTPETAFSGLKNKKVVVSVKNGETIVSCKYLKTYFFNDGEFAQNNCVYFELVDENGKHIFIAGSEIWKIETT